MSDYTFTRAEPDVQENTKHLFKIIGTALALTAPLNKTQLKEIKAMLDKDAEADIDFSASNRGGNTLLMQTLRLLGTIPDIRKMIDAGSDIHARNKSGNSALGIAAYTGGRTEEVRVLLEDGADMGAYSGSVLVPLASAVEDNRIEVVKKLLSAGASAQEQNTEGKSALTVHDAARGTMNESMLHLQKHYGKWRGKLGNFERGAYTPASREDWNHLASVLPVADPRHVPSVAVRLWMLQEMRPDVDLNLGTLRQRAVRVQAKAEGL